MENLNIEIGLPIAWEIEGNDDITLRYIPAGKKAIGFHKGAYSELVTMFERLTRFITEKGYNPSGVVYEYYYNSPEEVPETELLTKAEFILE
jgi:effector-binding domain-containing protein